MRNFASAVLCAALLLSTSPALAEVPHGLKGSAAVFASYPSTIKIWVHDSKYAWQRNDAKKQLFTVDVPAQTRQFPYIFPTAATVEFDLPPGVVPMPIVVPMNGWGDVSIRYQDPIHQSINCRPSEYSSHFRHKPFPAGVALTIEARMLEPSNFDDHDGKYHFNQCYYSFLANA